MMSLELVANDGSSRVVPLFASTNEIRTIKIMLGSTMVELSTTLQANSPTSLDVVLQQHQDPVAPLPSSKDATTATSLPQEIEPPPQPQATKVSTTSATETSEIASTDKQEKKNQKLKTEKSSKEARNWLLMVATIFATMTYEAGLSPPHDKEGKSSSLLATLSGNVTDIINITTPSVINTTMVYNISSNITTPSNESDECKKFVWINTIAFVYSMGAIVLLLSDTMCDMLNIMTDLKAVTILNAGIIVLAYSLGCSDTKNSGAFALGLLIAMCVIASADYAYRKIFKKESIIKTIMQCLIKKMKNLKDYKVGKCSTCCMERKRQSRLLSGEQENVEALAAGQQLRA